MKMWVLAASAVCFTQTLGARQFHFYVLSLSSPGLIFLGQTSALVGLNICLCLFICCACNLSLLIASQPGSFAVNKVHFQERTLKNSDTGKFKFKATINILCVVTSHSAHVEGCGCSFLIYAFVF